MNDVDAMQRWWCTEQLPEESRDASPTCARLQWKHQHYEAKLADDPDRIKEMEDKKPTKPDKKERQERRIEAALMKQQWCAIEGNLNTSPCTSLRDLKTGKLKTEL